MTYATVCSGVECMSAACPDLPLTPIFFAEIEPFPCAVLKSHFPTIPNLGDMSQIKVLENGKITNGRTTIILPAGGLDILAGGTPCQDVSEAGNRAGMAEGSGTRSSLAFEFVRLVRELKPRYVLWENVAGVLSSPDFPKFLTALADCGYGLAYRTLDAQYVRCADIDHANGGVVGLERAIPQRRRRVWVVGCAGEDIDRAAQILFEHPSVCGDTPPRRYTRQDIARASSRRPGVYDSVVDEARQNDITQGFRSGSYAQFVQDGAAGTLDCNHLDSVGNGSPGLVVDATALASFELCSRHAVPIDLRNALRVKHNGQGAGILGENDASPTLCADFIPGAAVETYENHASGMQPIRKVECAPTMGAQHNTSAENNNPLAVCYDGYNQSVHEEVSMTLRAAASGADGNDADPKIFGINPQASLMYPCNEGISQTLTLGHKAAALVDAKPTYIVRRLTPLECERLMGLPEWWTIPVMPPEDITDELVNEFRQIHDTFGAIMAAYAKKPAPKPKTSAFVRKWLERITDPDTCPDAPRYKACGNGWATNQPRWILLRLLNAAGIDPWHNNQKEQER